LLSLAFENTFELITVNSFSFENKTDKWKTRDEEDQKSKFFHFTFCTLEILKPFYLD
jgi:hypothetical protein